MADEGALQPYKNGHCTFNIGLMNLYWNTGTENIYTSDPLDADGVPLADEALAAVTVAAGDTVGTDTPYFTFGEGPVPVVLTTSEDYVVYAGSPEFRVEGNVIEVHPTPAQIDRAATPYADPFYAPATPAPITGEQGTDDTTILAAVVSALNMLGLVDDQTTVAE
ncbi:MAG: hypothetical protein IPN92_21045 [Chromatiaceae bacterium]|nr:hypothetical protein [Chromatiaceae bacterium]